MSLRFGNPAILAIARRTRGFASPDYSGFAFFRISIIKDSEVLIECQISIEKSFSNPKFLKGLE